MKKIALLLASSAAIVASPALAQEVNSTFTGPRVEAIVGYDVSKAGSSVDNDTSDSDDESIDGLLYGIGAGFDFAAGGVVLGVEGEYTESTAKTGFDNGDFEGIGFGNVKAGRDLYVGGRVGFKAAPQTLVYAKAGYTNARYDVLGERRHDRAEVEFRHRRLSSRRRGRAGDQREHFREGRVSLLEL